MSEHVDPAKTYVQVPYRLRNGMACYHERYSCISGRLVLLKDVPHLAACSKCKPPRRDGTPYLDWFMGMSIEVEG